MEGNDYPSVNPRVILSFPSQDRADLIIRVPVPSRRAGKIEQAILKNICPGRMRISHAVIFVTNSAITPLIHCKILIVLI